MVICRKFFLVVLWVIQPVEWWNIFHGSLMKLWVSVGLRQKQQKLIWTCLSWGKPRDLRSAQHQVAFESSLGVVPQKLQDFPVLEVLRLAGAFIQ